VGVGRGSGVQNGRLGEVPAPALEGGRLKGSSNRAAKRAMVVATVVVVIVLGTPTAARSSNAF
jgi:hypothetical protein